MKKTIAYILSLLLCALFLSALPLKGEAKLYDSVIRLHILANSNGEDDQELKLKVRDEILKNYSERLKDAESIEEATSELSSLLEEIKKTCESVIECEGYDYNVDVIFEKEYYPERVYENSRFPAGNYLSLRIIIGEGEGKNWWCVLFPPLCLKTAYGDSVTADDSIPVGLTPEQYKLISNSQDTKYILKFKMLEILENIFEK